MIPTINSAKLAWRRHFTACMMESHFITKTLLRRPYAQNNIVGHFDLGFNRRIAYLAL